MHVRRALISVSDKSDLVPFARALADRGVEIISTGGTARALEQAGIPVTPIDAVTGFPEIMDGRVKTLHPSVHGALLGVRDNPEHVKAMREHNIAPIDLVCVNLYPFERTVAQPDVDHAEAVEQIDIGGPSMLRSAAKNFAYVAVVSSPTQYDRVISNINENAGATSLALRADLAAGAFSRTAGYDAAIASYLSRRGGASGAGGDPFPEVLRLAYLKVDALRYGENPHQDAALYRDPASTGPSVVNAELLHGKRLSYNNILDAAAALELVKELRRLERERVGAAVIKHRNACGAATADNALDAVDRALIGDPLAAYGGILAVNRPIDLPAAQRIGAEGVFLEVIVAPSFEPDALDFLKNRWATVRLIASGERAGAAARKLDYRSVPGGMLVQDRDTRSAATEQWTHAAGPAPTPERLAAAAVVWTAVKHLNSNAIAIGGLDPEKKGAARLFGQGCGMVDRVSACRLAVEKSGALTKGAIAASDAFFPFSDGPKVLIDAGVTMLVHPGGSKRDEDTIELCKSRNVTCMITAVRHFRH
ncbi:MAG: bifunctional phosphoribosylaminoimidazolecarboxamide formyltransferase/IMP cyclohydrolase [Phycisphaerales bacterium]|nr:bifunctional phosphoribosylaminoimidazolecarboxamide formyltransferase/IMP cyclohydrolase [Phycisphaerales bacterium]